MENKARQKHLALRACTPLVSPVSSTISLSMTSPFSDKLSTDAVTSTCPRGTPGGGVNFIAFPAQKRSLQIPMLCHFRKFRAQARRMLTLIDALASEIAQMWKRTGSVKRVKHATFETQTCFLTPSLSFPAGLPKRQTSSSHTQDF